MKENTATKECTLCFGIGFIGPSEIPCTACGSTGSLADNGGGLNEAVPPTEAQASNTLSEEDSEEDVEAARTTAEACERCEGVGLISPHCPDCGGNGCDTCGYAFVEDEDMGANVSCPDCAGKGHVYVPAPPDEAFKAKPLEPLDPDKVRAALPPGGLDITKTKEALEQRHRVHGKGPHPYARTHYKPIANPPPYDPGPPMPKPSKRNPSD